MQGSYFSYLNTLQEENRAERGIFIVLKTFSNLLKDKFFMGIAITQAFIMSSMFAYIAGSSFVLQNIYGVSPQQFSFFFALNSIGIIIGAQTSRRLAGYFKEVNILFVGVIMSFSGSVLLAIVVWRELSLAFISLALFIVVSSVGVVSPTAFSLAMETQGKSAGSASAFLGLIPFVGGAIVSPLVGLAGELSATPLAIVIFLCSSSALIVNLYVRKTKPLV